MSRLPRVVFALALVGQLLLLGPKWVERFDPVSGSEIVHGLVWVAGASLIGRVLLSLLPPGPVGRHVPGSLGETWGASLLLGYSVVALQQRFLLPDELSKAARLGWNVAPWIVIAGLRSLMLPAAMVPGHALAHERGPAWSRALTWISIAAALALDLAHGGTPFWGAGLLLLDAGLRTMRRAPLERALLVAFAATVTPTLGAVLSLVQGVYLVAGLLFGLRWIRRADRRSLILACLMISLGGSSSGYGLESLATLAVLAAAAHAPQRRSAWPWLLAAAALPLWRLWRLWSREPVAGDFVSDRVTVMEHLQLAWARSGLFWPLVLVALVIGLPRLRAIAPPSSAPLERPDPIRRETLCALAFVLATAIGHVASFGTDLHPGGPSSTVSLTVLIFPSALLAVGLLLASTEPAGSPAG